MNKALLFLPLLILTGCQTTFDKVGYVRKDKLEEQIEFIKAENAKALANKEVEIKSSLKEVIEGKNAQIQKASNSLYGASLTRPYFKDEPRPLLIIFNRVDEAKSALGVGPTLEAMHLEQERLIKELDETLTSIEELKTTHAAEIKKNEQLVIETQSHLLRVTELEKEKERIKQDGLDKLLNKQEELNKLNDQLLAKEKLNAEYKKYIEKNKRDMMIALGACSLIGLIVAIYIPLFRKKAGYFAAITGGAAICIPFIQQSHINIGLGLGVLYIAYLVIKDQLVSHKTNENLINAVQEIKDLKPNLYKDEIKPLLDEWNKKYLSDGTKVDDKAVVKHIDEILRDYEKK
jgi:hypothetical protein